MADYIPVANEQFKLWADQFIDYASKNGASLGLTAEQIALLTEAHSKWQASYDNYMSLQKSLSTARQENLADRKELQASVRPLVRWLQNNPDITNAHRTGFGIPIPDTIKTAASAPTKAPEAKVDITQRLQHTIRLSRRRAKPKGVMGCEIWMKISDTLPSDPSEFTLLGVVSSSSFTATYNGSDAGKTAHYLLRWVTGKGEHGPWSETYSYVIPK